MTRFRPFIVVLVYLASWAALTVGQAVRGDVMKTVHVAPVGNDANAGTESQPLATIGKARDAVRRINQEMTGDIVVILHGGTYQISETIVLDHRDSGTGGYNVVYRSAPGEHAVISGGRGIAGWQPDADGRWKAKTDLDNFRQLYINGKRAERARGGVLPGAELYGKDGYKTTLAEMADWKNPTDIELVYYVMWGQAKAWTHTRCKVERIKRDGNHAVVTMLQPHFTIARTKQGVQVKSPAYIENAFELLDEPGEWYLDRSTHTVYCIPKSGEEMKTARVIAPAVEKLLELRGTLDKPVENVHFEGITFSEASWLRPSRIGLVDVQANFLVDLQKAFTNIKPWVTTIHNENIKSPSNIVCRSARRIRFERCTFTRLGSGGLDLEFGAQDNTVSACHFYDISGTAIQIGDVLKDDHHPDDHRKIVKNNSVVNNYIHDCCLEYQGGVGIFVGYTDGTNVAHNEICRLSYSGISVGWGWGEEDAGGGAYAHPSSTRLPPRRRTTASSTITSIT